MRHGHSRSDEMRNDLTGEHKVGDAGQITLAILFFVVWTADSFFLGLTTFFTQVLPLTLRIILGVALIILSGYIARKGLSIVFSETREKPEVIAKGVFSVVRHPIYLSAIMFYLGFLLFSLSLAAFFIWLVAIVFYIHISRHAEKLLLEKYGREYQDYINSVPMLIPRIRR